VTATRPSRGRRARFDSSACYLSDQLKVRVEWLAVHQVEGDCKLDSAATKYLSLTPHTGLFSQHDLAPYLWITPRRLTPKQGFHRLATRRNDDIEGEFVRTPYAGVKFSNRLAGEVTSVTGEFFPGGILLTRIGAKLQIPLGLRVQDALHDLLSVRSPKSVTSVDGLVRAMAGFVAGRPRLTDNALAYDSFFSMHISLPEGVGDFDKALEGIRQDLVALLIGTERAHLLQSDLVDAVYDASAQLNVKARAELLLMNRQGFLYATPAGKYAGPHVHRFERTRDLAMLALYARTFLRHGHSFATEKSSQAGSIVQRLEQWIEFANVTFDASVSHTVAWTALSESLLLQERLDAWRSYFAALGSSV